MQGAFSCGRGYTRGNESVAGRSGAEFVGIVIVVVVVSDGVPVGCVGRVGDVGGRASTT